MVLVLVLGAFLAGSIPFGVLIARGLGVDIQAKGSGNIGATNVTRVLGPVAGAIVLVLDAAKGALPTLLAAQLCGEPCVVIAVGAATIVGHCFSPFLGFRGGKGVATSLGVYLVLAPELVPVAIVVFAIVTRTTRVPALGSLAATATLAALLLVRGDIYSAGLGVAVTALLIYTHRSNLAKLRR